MDGKLLARAREHLAQIKQNNAQEAQRRRTEGYGRAPQVRQMDARLKQIMVEVFGAAMGLGVTFSALFILVFQGGLTLLAGVISPYLGADVVAEMSAVGGTILIGMGLNMLELSPKKIKSANMLPGIFLPIAYIPLYELITKLF